MADTPEIPKTLKPVKPRTRAAKPRSRIDRPPDLDGDGDLRSQIARRAYEISQSASAGDDEENWLRAERELRAKAR
jgi:hypothetical protein